MQAVVSNAVGLSASRGDAISVVSVPFEGESIMEAVEESTDIVAMAMMFQKPVVALFGILIALMLSTRVLGTIKTMAPQRRLAAPVTGAAPQIADEMPQMEALSQPALTPEQVGPQVTNPTMTARVVRSWLNEA